VGKDGRRKTGRRGIGREKGIKNELKRSLVGGYPREQKDE
jgi:hypothetical protein